MQVGAVEVGHEADVTRLDVAREDDVIAPFVHVLRLGLSEAGGSLQDAVDQPVQARGGRGRGLHDQIAVVERRERGHEQVGVHNGFGREELVDGPRAGDDGGLVVLHGPASDRRRRDVRYPAEDGGSLLQPGVVGDLLEDAAHHLVGSDEVGQLPLPVPHAELLEVLGGEPASAHVQQVGARGVRDLQAEPAGEFEPDVVLDHQDRMRPAHRLRLVLGEMGQEGDGSPGEDLLHRRIEVQRVVSVALAPSLDELRGPAVVRDDPVAHRVALSVDEIDAVAVSCAGDPQNIGGVHAADLDDLPHGVQIGLPQQIHVPFAPSGLHGFGGHRRGRHGDHRPVDVVDGGLRH